MAVVKWSAPSVRTGGAVASLNGLANNSSALIATISNADYGQYACITIKLGSVAMTTLSYFVVQISPDAGSPTFTVGIGGDAYTISPCSAAGTASRTYVIPMVKLSPMANNVYLRNFSGSTLSASGNEVYVRTYNESIS